MIAPAQETRAQRFTVDGSEALETLLQNTCEHVRRSLERAVPMEKLEGLLLAGGYGRGEGGVLNGERPYNDLDFYVFLRGNHLWNGRRFGEALHALGEQLSREAGIEIELKLDSLARWRHAPVSMFSYDVLMGHRWILGDDLLFAGCEYHRDASRIPSAEAARLLLNRCSGLLFAAEHLHRNNFTGAEADFVARNIAKAQLGMGDACLAMFGQYHWSCTERNERVKHLELPWAAELEKHHAAGVEFKLHPKLSDGSATVLRQLHREVTAFAQRVWLWLEARRLGVEFHSVKHYSSDPRNKCPETPAWRNTLVSFRAFRTLSTHYPRERLYRALPLLLWEADRLPIVDLQKLLMTDAEDFRSLVRAYHRIWRRFN